MQDPRFMSSTQAQAANIDAGLRAYMLGVYNHMTIGMAITGFFAYLTKFIAVNNQAFFNAVYISPLKWVVMLAPLGMVFWLSARVNKMEATTARALFFTFAAVMGVSLSTILFVYTGASIVKVFFITAASFSALSIYGYSTKRDLSPMGSFLMMGLVGLIIASIVNMFLQDGMFQFIISFFGVLIFAGLTAYDTQSIKLMYRAGDDRSTALKKSVMGALRLYLDFINMFIMLLQLLGNRE